MLHRRALLSGMGISLTNAVLAQATERYDTLPFWTRLFNPYLEAANEPPIGQWQAEDFAARLLVDAAFGGVTVVQVTHVSGHLPEGRVIQVTHKPNDGPFPLSHRTDFKVSDEQVLQLRLQITTSGFWDEPFGDDRIGEDGYEFLLDVKDGMQHRALARWVPQQRDAVASVATRLFRLAGLATLVGVF
jgi:hypothetical protein